MEIPKYFLFLELNSNNLFENLEKLRIKLHVKIFSGKIYSDQLGKNNRVGTDTPAHVLRVDAGLEIAESGVKSIKL